MTILTASQLEKQKAIYEQVLVNELLYEVKFLWDQMGDRAQSRADFKDKLIKLIGGVISKALSGAAIVDPFIGLAGVLLDTAQTGLEAYIECCKQKKVGTLGDFLYSSDIKQLAIMFEQLAKQASLRYEYLIASRLSLQPEEGVIPFACAGARRIIEFLLRISQKIAELDSANINIEEFPISLNLLLDGLIQGRSGKWRDGISNNSLKDKDNPTLKLSAEGAYGRSAMRAIPHHHHIPLGEWPIGYRLEPLHKKQEADKYSDWGRVKLLDGDIKKGPKYGYMLVEPSVIKAYGYLSRFGEDINTNSQYAYYPTTIIAKQNDVIDYNKAIVAELRDGNEVRTSFLAYMQHKYQAKHRRIDRVWVQDANFSNAVIQGDYTDVCFSGCIFKEVRNAIFLRASLIYLQAADSSWSNVSLNEADARYSNFDGAKFDEQVTYIRTQWAGAKTHIKLKAKRIESIEKIKANQADKAEKMANIVIELREKHAALEKKANQHTQAINKHFEEIDENLKQQSIEVLALANELRQAQLDHQLFQVYCKAELNKLKIVEEKSDLQQKEINIIQEKIKILDEANIKISELYDGLYKRVTETELTAEKLTAIKTELSTEYKDFRDKMQKQINNLTIRIDQVETEIERIKQQSHQTARQTITAKGHKDITVKKGGKVKLGSVNAHLAKFHGEFNEAERELFKNIINKAAEANAEAHGNENIQVDEDASFSARDISAVPLVYDKRLSVPTSASQTLFSSPPLTRTDKELINKAKDILDKVYPEADANNDEDTKVYREEQLSFLNGFKKRKLTKADKDNINSLIKELGEEELSHEMNLG